MKSLHRKYLIIFFFLMTLTGCQPTIANRDSSGTTVVCFGDSLTAGYGAAAGHDYPSLLAQKIALPVINAGVSGNTTADALARLDTDVLSHNPKMVIITLGANDFFQNLPEKETLANMKKIIEAIKSHGAMVVWAEVRMGLWWDPYLKDFKGLAQREHILLIPNILRGIIDNPALKYDQIHPNDEGYKIMAKRIYNYIKSYLPTETK
ncbi:MAG: arylesterase [Candidatus Omnitrophica bacterium]|nr:arylesterase [Candidatus Omnitrophota bacterium]MDE2223152.1 arylesterase [Candidatus Omnitrophota bacterium]